MENLADTQVTLGVSFRDTSLLKQALVHGSYTNESPADAPVPNDRLEFLGDAVLGLVIGARLFLDFPGLSEGELTKLRAVLVRGATLARVARKLDLGRFLYLGKGEDATEGRNKPANLAGAMEAIIGAVYLDQGLAAAEDFVLRLLTPELQAALENGSHESYKSDLQEILQARDQRTPTYHVVSATGPDHDRLFTVEVRLGDTVLGSGSGRSKKSAETDAARAILKRILANVTG